jgi:hypothetical protein
MHKLVVSSMVVAYLSMNVYAMVKVRVFESPVRASISYSTASRSSCGFSHPLGMQVSGVHAPIRRLGCVIQNPTRKVDAGCVCGGSSTVPRSTFDSGPVKAGPHPDGRDYAHDAAMKSWTSCGTPGIVVALRTGGAGVGV